MLRKVLAGAAFAAVPFAALAQDAFIEGVYLATPELCERARQGGLQTLIDQSTVVLSARGFDAVEHNCRFLDINVREGGGAWLAQALCEEPGGAYPELFALIERQAGQLEITGMSGRFAGGGAAPIPEPEAGSGTPPAGNEEIAGDQPVGMEALASEPFVFTRCEGVELP